ncbi:MAG: hypothetical protein CBB71_10795 [Rhodopirellula sp. TMED11]|nr:MAG: hypothetical protein CBB71_10795 [Rhodopirellula sp. TMED11]
MSHLLLKLLKISLVMTWLSLQGLADQVPNAVGVLHSQPWVANRNSYGPNGDCIDLGLFSPVGRMAANL